MQDDYYDFLNKTHAGLTTILHFWFMVGILFYSKVRTLKEQGKRGNSSRCLELAPSNLKHACTQIRVSKLVTDYNILLKQFPIHFYFDRNYFWSSAVCKILTFKVNFLCLKLSESFWFFFHWRIIVYGHIFCKNDLLITSIFEPFYY